MNNNSLSVILPVYNEENNIKTTIEHSVDFLKKQDYFSEYEIIAVNDGSADQTALILEKLVEQLECLKIVTHSKNMGYGRSLVSGVCAARFSWVLMMDSDGQLKINALSDMVSYIPDYDIITGYRHKRRDPFHRILIGKVYTFLACSLFGFKLKDVNCGFKLLRKEILNFADPICHAGAFYTGVYVQAKAQNCRIKEVPVEHYSRSGGRQTGTSLKVMLTAVFDLIRLSSQKRNG